MVKAHQSEASSSRSALKRVTKRHCDESDDDNDRRAADRKTSGQPKRRKYNEDHLRLFQIHQARQNMSRHNLRRENKSLRQENEELRRLLRISSEKEHMFRRTIDDLVMKTAEQAETVQDQTEEIKELQADLTEEETRGEYYHGVLVNLRDTIEKQFTCSVCTEVLIKANTLHCGHTFCSHCLEEWERLNPSCPMCRAAIMCKHPAKLMDDHIDTLVEQFYSDDRQKSRSNLVQERIRRKEERDQEPLPQQGYGEPINIILSDDLGQIPRTVQMYIMTRVFDEQMQDYLQQMNTPDGQQDPNADFELPMRSPRSRTAT